MGLRRTAILLVVSLLAFANHGCEREIGERAASEPVGARETVKRPNIILVIWDTARADRMSVYGHSAPTTPFLDEWSRSARVFERCVSAGNQTSPTHASIFTGYWPAEHGVDNEAPRLAADFTTLAELLRDAGYDTYMFADNPRLSRENGFSQGFDVVEHPWSPAYREQVHATLLEQVPPYDQSSRTRQDLLNPKFAASVLKEAGVVTRAAVERWLAQRKDAQRPIFMVLNYMQVHSPLIPPRAYREKLMSTADVDASYTVVRRAPRVWDHMLVQPTFSAEELRLWRLTYDASVLVLDDLFRDLMETLGGKGLLDDAVVVLTSDHGEHLGEHNMLGHVHSVYEELLWTPLLVHYPERLAPGRDTNLVSNMDLFPTLLALADVPMPIESHARSLLMPDSQRTLIGQSPTVYHRWLKRARTRVKESDLAYWNQPLVAYYHPPYKLIRGASGRTELYHFPADRRESKNVLADEPDAAGRMIAECQAYMHALTPVAFEPAPDRHARDPERLRRLRALGYIGETEDPEDDLSP